MPSRSHLGRLARQRRRPPGRRGNFAAVQTLATPVRAIGSSNVQAFAWQPFEEQDLADFQSIIATYGSLEYGAMRLRIDHNPDGVLIVTFKNGSTYQYAPVTLQVFLDMMAAPSRGKYVWDVLRRQQYPYIGPM